jgi:hypothetical protein
VPLDIQEPDLGPLRRELGACRIRADRIPDAVARLIRPPLKIALSACADPEPGATINLGRGKLGKFAPPDRAFDGDAAAVLLYLNEGRLDSQPTWKLLSRAERKKAKLLWEWFGKNHGLNVTPRGASPMIAVALVLWCMRALCEEAGRREFPRLSTSHPSATRKLSSPMWRALNEALPLAQSFLRRRYPGYGAPTIDRRVDAAKKRGAYRIDKHIEGAAELVRVVRSKSFDDLCRKWGLGPSADDVEASPATFRLAIAEARKSPKRWRP